MKAILVTFDSLNRRWLQPYGGTQIATPNFQRLAARSVTFDNAYVASMPCMPARREIHTGRYNFLHAPWGGLEPYDFSMPAALSAAGIYTHHCTDHQHYWEDGGHHYMQRYDSHEMFRGQEADRWKGSPDPIDLPPLVHGRKQGPVVQMDGKNRQHWKTPDDWPMAQTVRAGLDFIDRAAESKCPWFLHIETFDPHEPFCAPPEFREKVPGTGDSPRCDWPPYGRAKDFGITPKEAEACRAEYSALVAFCDAQLGRILDAMDEHDLWEDTLLIVHTDHGFFLGERDYFGKSVMPFHRELANIPFFIHDPRHPEAAGQRRKSLLQTPDLPATLLRWFEQPLPGTMTGKDLAPVIANDEPGREAGLFGIFGGLLHVITNDGLCGFFIPDETLPLHVRSLGFANMRGFVSAEALRELEFDRVYDFTDGIRLLRYPAATRKFPYEWKTQCFDLKKDPDQRHPFEDEATTSVLMEHITRIFGEHDAPEELYLRHGIKLVH